MNSEVKEFLNKISCMLFPEDITCIFCGNEVNESLFCLCDACEKEIFDNQTRCSKCDNPIHNESKFCQICSQNSREFDAARAKFIYKDKIAAKIKQFKYENKKFYAKAFAALMLVSFLELKNLGYEFDFIVPIPLHEEKLKERGFNQSELIANEFSKLVDIPVETDVVKRVVNTPSQTNFSKIEREANMKNAFKVVNKKFCKNKSILILDDIITTGATAESLAKELKKAGAASVCAIALARTEIKEGV
ncbi:MAG: ComF family protein [Clostridia bacterium]|nr:ComF family protein [Clostridia bacterium]